MVIPEVVQRRWLLRANTAAAAASSAALGTHIACDLRGEGQESAVVLKRQRRGDCHATRAMNAAVPVGIVWDGA